MCPIGLRMTKEEETVLMIKGAIATLSLGEREACNELAEHMHRQLKSAGDVVGTLALALVGAEIELAASKT